MKNNPTKVQGKRNKIMPSRSKDGKFMKFFKIAEFWIIFILCFIFHILHHDTQHIKQKRFEDMSVCHHQGDVRYGASRGILCSCMSLISVSWTLFKSPGFLVLIWIAY